jgi:2-polyprenyl-3-methyl-5-hydroxy-6-metoxy-1,4-benzoquinol methylase
MNRTPEPELMDDEAQALAYFQADHTEPHDRFVALHRTRLGEATGSVLDLGCGPGDIAMRFAKANPGCTVHGLDGSAAMVRLGQAAIEQAGLAERVRLQVVFLPLTEPANTQHETVISNSLLHHLADPQVLWRTLRQVAAPGAAIFVVDLARPPSAEAVEAMVAAYAGQESEQLQIDFRASLHAAYRPDEVRAQLTAEGLGTLLVEQFTDRHLLICGRLP